MTHPHPSSRNPLKNAIMATMETAALLKRGPMRFENTFPAVVQSFVFVLLVAFPVNAYILFLFHQQDPQIGTIPYGDLLGRYIGMTCYNFSFLMLMLFFFAKSRNSERNFAACICGLNWMSLIPVMIFIPPLILVTLGFHTILEIQDFAILVTVYELFLTGFVIRHTLQAGFFAAGFLTLMIFIMQNMALMATFSS